MFKPPHILRAITRLALCLIVITTSLIPSFAMASGRQAINMSRYLCAPAAHTNSSEAETALRALLIAAGKISDDEHNDIPAAPCEHCVFTAMALPAPLVQDGIPSNFAPANKHIYFNSDITAPYNAQGPPLGGRAPPSFS